MGHTTHKCGDTADALRNVRAGCTVRMRVKITDGGIALDWTDPLLSIGDVAVWSQARQGIVGRPTFSVSDDDPDLLDVVYTTGPVDLPGPHRLLVTVKYNGWTAVHTVLAYNLVGSAYGCGTSVTVSGECAEETEVDVILKLHEIDTTYLQCLIDALVRLRVDESERLTTLEVLTEGLRTDVDANAEAIGALARKEADDILAMSEGLAKVEEAVESAVSVAEGVAERLETDEKAISTLTEGMATLVGAVSALTDVGDRVSTLETNYTALERSVSTLETCCNEVKNTLTDLEDRVRRLEEGGTSSDPDRTITFVVSPTDATLTVNGSGVTLTDGRYVMTAKDGDSISWSCGRDGYVTQSGTRTVDGDATITITLAEEAAVDPDRTITFVVEPTHSKLVINGTTYQQDADTGILEYIAHDGDVLEWEVSYDGYVTQSGTHTVDGDTTISVELVASDRTITFRVTLADATAYDLPREVSLDLNGTAVSVGADGTATWTAKDGDVIGWSASYRGFVDCQGTHAVDGDAEVEVAMERGEYYLYWVEELLHLGHEEQTDASATLVSNLGFDNITVSSDSSWLTCGLDSSGDKMGYVYVRATENTGVERSDVITAHSDAHNRTAKLNVEQDGA